MGDVILITGGARSGKSRKAEEIASGYKDVVYVATALPLDDEMKQRIQKHRERRPPGWITVEKHSGLGDVIRENTAAEVILIDCITVLISNILIEMDVDWDNPSPADFEKAEKEVLFEIEDIINALGSFKGCLILVTNEVGMSLVPEHPLGRAFRDIAGFVNQRLAKVSVKVYLMVSGIPLKIKG